MITPDIDQALDDLEATHRIRVLFACESGSRAWGFASPDSDFDLRFIYVHEPEWYLSIQERRDVLDAMLPNDLDLSGWELRKALRLFAKSNASLFEWLGSPIVYRANSKFQAETQALITSYFNPISSYHHYLSIAKRKGSPATDSMKIKQLFYVLRPLLACRWIRHAGGMPPTAFADLLATDWVSDAERADIAELLAQKAVAKEAELIQLSNHWQDWLQHELAAAGDAAAELVSCSRPDAEFLDSHFRRWVASYGRTDRSGRESSLLLPCEGGTLTSSSGQLNSRA